MAMQWQTALRIVGIAGVVVAYYVFTKLGTNLSALVVVITAILTLVGPEVIDAFPFGPNK